MVIKPESLSEQLLYSTTLIITRYADGTQGVGTGFFFQYPIDEERKLPIVITNKHVIENGDKGIFHLHKGTRDNGVIEPTGEFFQVEINDFMNQWFYHPDDDIDLCAMAIQPIREQASSLGHLPYIVDLTVDLIWSDEKLHELLAVEEILMIGYPIGLWDSVNNFPVIRRGITASHPAVDFNGKSMSIVDVACFPGSSGSPVMIVNEGIYGSKKGAVVDSRGILLGILFAGPTMTAEGEIVIEAIPTSQIPKAKTSVMIHLGYMVKAKEIFVLGDAMVNHYKKTGRL